MEVEIQNSIHESTVILASGKISQPCWLTPSFWKSIIYKMGLSFIPWHSQLYCSGHLLFSCSVVSLCDPMDSVVSDSLWPHGLQHSRLPCLSSSPRAYSNSCPLSQWCHQPSHSLSPPSPPAFNLSQHQGLSQQVSSSHQVTKVLELHLQHQSFQWVFRVDFL